MDKKNLLLSETKFLPEEEEIYLNSPRQDTINFIKALWHAFTNLLARVQSVDGKYYYTYTLFELFSGRNLQIVSLVNRRAMLRMAKGNTPGYLKQVLDTAQKASVDEKGNISAHILHTASLALLNDDDSTIIEFVDLENREGLPAHLLPFIRPFMKTATGLAITTGKQVLGILWGVSAFRLNREERKELTERLSSVHKAISTILEVENSAGSEPRDIARTIENIDIYSRYEKVFSIDIPYSTCPPRTVVGYSYRYACKFRTDTNFVIPTRKGFAVSLKRYLPEKPANKNTILLMIPGFFCNRGLMSILAREMAFRYRYTTFTMDLRGRSKCTMPESSREDWNVDDYIMEDFPITLDWLKTQYPNARFVIIGHSMGGMIPRFYTGSYKKILEQQLPGPFPDPFQLIKGVITITSPTYVNVESRLPGFNLLKGLIRTLGKNFVAEAIIRTTSAALSTAVPTISLNQLFQFLHSLTGVKGLTFTLGKKLLTLRDFVGYRQITSPEWYLTLEDIFCKESLMSITQFLKAQIEGVGFYSFDKKINYTEDQINFSLPLFTIVGEEDTIAPPDTVIAGNDLVVSENRKIRSYPQGHLGIIIHPPTVQQIATDALDWIKTL